MGADYVFDELLCRSLPLWKKEQSLFRDLPPARLKAANRYSLLVVGMATFAKSQFPHLVKYFLQPKSPRLDVWRSDENNVAQKLGSKGSPEQMLQYQLCHVSLRRAGGNGSFSMKSMPGRILTLFLPRELVKMIRAAHISPETLEDRESDASDAGRNRGRCDLPEQLVVLWRRHFKARISCWKGENPPVDAL